MSPRRRFEAGHPPSFRLPDPHPPRGKLAVIGALAAAVIIAAVTISGVVFITDQMARRAQIREAAVLSFVRTFITQYTSPDPFNANDYADRVLALGTGNFAKMYSERMNEVVIQTSTIFSISRWPSRSAERQSTFASLWERLISAVSRCRGPGAYSLPDRMNEITSE